MVDQPEYGTNTPFFIDFLPICLSAKLVNPQEIRALYVEQGLSAAQVARRLRISKAVVLARLHGLGIRDDDKPKRYTSPENYRCPVPPFGYSVEGGKLVTSKAELRVCHAIVELIQRSGLSSTATAKELSRRKLKNRAGSSNWSHGSVLAIYRRWKDKI
jgi:hypothetical protein